MNFMLCGASPKRVKMSLESGGEGQRRRNETKGRLDSGDHRKEAVKR